MTCLALALLTLLPWASAQPWTTLPVTQVMWEAEKGGLFLGSPSIVRCPADGSLVVSHDNFGSTVAFGGIHRSVDGGATWVRAPPLQPVPALYWATLFVRENDSRVYAMGVTGDNSRGPAQITVGASADCGVTFGAFVNITTGAAGYSTGPTPVLEKDGRLWRAFERNDGAWPSGYSTLAVSAPVDADILVPANWNVSGALGFSAVAGLVPASWSRPDVRSDFGWLEGNAVDTADGSPGINIVLRVNSPPAANKAALVHLSSPSATPAFVRWIDFFPGGNSKFTIRRDNATGVFVTLGNYVDESAPLVSEPPTCGTASLSASGASTATARPCCSISQQEACEPAPANCIWCHANSRNVLSLAVSHNLSNWTLAGAPVLFDDTGIPKWTSELFTGFQYVDFQFIDGDIIAAVRSAYRGANAYHNSNRILFTRVANWRSRLPSA
jgi:hypothetical protein